MAEEQINIVHIQRRQGRFFSIERLFEDVRGALPEWVQVEVWRANFESRGIFRRLYDIVGAALNQAEVNHVTGDVHFLTYLLSRSKTILTINDCVTLERLGGIRKKIFWFFWYWLPVRRSRLITVISESTRDELLRYVKRNPEDIVVIHCPVSAMFSKFRKEFNSDCPRILQVGTTQNKNIQRLAAALRKMSCRLVIIGKLDDSQLNALRENEIDFESKAALSDEALLEEYRACDLVAFVSIYEGFGLPIVEANAVGRPVVCSNLYSMPEVAGNAACLVDPFNVSEIRKGIQKVISDEEFRTQLIENGFENVKRFEAGKIAAQYADLYANIRRANKATLS